MKIRPKNVWLSRMPVLIFRNSQIWGFQRSQFVSLMNVKCLIIYNYHCLFINLLFRSATLLLFLLHLYSCCFLIRFQSISQDHISLKPNKTRIRKKSRIKEVQCNPSCQQCIFFKSQQITLRFATSSNFWRNWKHQQEGRLLFFEGKH